MGEQEHEVRLNGKALSRLVAVLLGGRAVAVMGHWQS